MQPFRHSFSPLVVGLAVGSAVAGIPVAGDEGAGPPATDAPTVARARAAVGAKGLAREEIGLLFEDRDAGIIRARVDRWK